MKVAVTTLFAIFVLCLTQAHARCQRCDPNVPSGWQHRVWNHPTTKRLVSLPLISLDYASEQALQLLNFLDPQLQENGHHKTCDVEKGKHGDHHEHRADGPSRPGLREMSLKWKDWMEQWRRNEWEENWPNNWIENWSTLWDQEDEEETQDAITRDDGGRFEDMVQKKQNVEQNLHQQQEELRMLEQNIENERRQMEQILEQQEAKLRKLEQNIEIERRQQKKQEELIQIQLHHNAEKVREQKRAERERAKEERQERKRIEDAQKELDKQIRQEQDRLRWLTEQQELFNKKQSRPGDTQQHAEEHGRTRQDISGRKPGYKCDVHQQAHGGCQSQFQDDQAKPSVQKTELFSLQIPNEYSPLDIKVKTSGTNLKIIGKRVCNCNENCVVKEFERGFKLPQDVLVDSLLAKFFNDGHLSIVGVTDHRAATKLVNMDIPVQPVGVFEENIKDRLKCLHKKAGFKMSKMDKSTGNTYEFTQSREDGLSKRVEPEYENDGVTIEVEEQ